MKVNNIMVDHNNRIALIDFDRMINESRKYEIKLEDFTKDFNSIFSAPELNTNAVPTYKCDIYSIGILIYYIFNEKLPQKDDTNSYLQNQHPNLYDIFLKCTNIDPEKDQQFLN